MKILFYINVLSGGGAERVISNLANKLSDEYEIIVVNSFKTKNEYQLNSKINHIYLGERNNKNLIYKNFYYIKKLRNILKQENPNIAISFMAEPNFRLIISTMFLKVKTITSIRNDPNREYPNFLFKILAKILFVKADGIVFQTSDAKNYFSKKIRNKSKIIYNPVKEDFYIKTECKNKKNIIAVGRLSEQKNHIMLIEAFDKVSRYTNDNLYIFGEGVLDKKLKIKINELNLRNRVFLKGNISNLHEILPNFKLYILSSDYEGMPNSLMEAMAVGLPCISTNCPCGGPKELLPLECLIPIKNVDELSNKIISFINDEEKLDYFGKKNEEKALELTNEKITQSWKKYIKEVINSKDNI